MRKRWPEVEATPRRREEARERGQVPLSSELVAALGLAAGVGALSLGGAQLARASSKWPRTLLIAARISHA